MKLSQNEKGSFTFSMDEQPWKESEIEKGNSQQKF